MRGVCICMRIVILGLSVWFKCLEQRPRDPEEVVSDTGGGVCFWQACMSELCAKSSGGAAEYSAGLLAQCRLTCQEGKEETLQLCKMKWERCWEYSREKNSRGIEVYIVDADSFNLVLCHSWFPAPAEVPSPCCQTAHSRAWGFCDCPSARGEMDREQEKRKADEMLALRRQGEVLLLA